MKLIVLMVCEHNDMNVDPTIIELATPLSQSDMGACRISQSQSMSNFNPLYRLNCFGWGALVLLESSAKFSTKLATVEEG